VNDVFDLVTVVEAAAGGLGRAKEAGHFQ
jgi:hypothetical protein